jgi:hypothetical protein
MDKKYPPLKSLQTVVCAWHLVKLVYQERVTVKGAGFNWNPKESLRIGAGCTLFRSRLICKVKFGYYLGKKEV